MKLKEIIIQVANSWAGYLSKVNIDKADEAYDLVLQTFPEVLKEITPLKEKFKFQGSKGIGRIPNAPWIAILDKSITHSAEDGYYLVFLFSTDLQVMYLSIAFGTTKFTKRFGGGKKLYFELRKAAGRIHGLIQGNGYEEVDKKIKLEAINLRASKKQKRQKDYEESSIYSIRYDLKNLPEEKELVSDYQIMLRLYEKISLRLSVSSVEELVDDLIDIPSHGYVEAKPFYLKIKESRQKNGKKGKGENVRRSDKSKKIGDAGEKFVYENEKIKLIKCGLKKEAEMVRLVSSENVGWDITSFDERGNEIYIEVKSSVASKISVVEVTRNEFEVLNEPDFKNKYFIYLVTNILKKSPGLEFIRDPSQKIKDGVLRVTPTVYKLGL